MKNQAAKKYIHAPRHENGEDKTYRTLRVKKFEEIKKAATTPPETPKKKTLRDKIIEWIAKIF